MLYELVAIVRTGNLSYVKDAARTTGSYILQNSGTIRSLNNYGVFDLPRPITKFQSKHHKGHYFTLLFDSASPVQDEIRRQLGLNPNLIRFSVIKIGDKLGGNLNQSGKIEDITGKLEWSESARNSIIRDIAAAKPMDYQTTFGAKREFDALLPRSRADAPLKAFNF